MTRQLSPTLEPDSKRLIDSRLSEEAFLAGHPFIKMFLRQGAWVVERFEVVLTETRLHFFKMDRTYWSRKPKSISWHTSMRLVDITDINVKETGDKTHLTLRTNADTQDTFISITSHECKELITALEGTVSQTRRSAAGAGTGSLAEELKKLSDPKHEWVLTEEDWERAKNLYFGKPNNKKDETVRMLRSLHDLHRSGVLSEGEFNMKKWDILSRDQ